MTVAVMRSILEDSGNVTRLYWAVRAAQIVSFDNIELQRRVFIRQFGGDTGSEPGKKGLKKPRSVQPHQTLARELDLLERKGRWILTAAGGRAFLVLWDHFGKLATVKFLVHQAFKFDRSFLVPFVEGILDRGSDMATATALAGEIWENLWHEHRKEMMSLEPPAPRELRNRTRVAQARGRLRFFLRPEGLDLSIEKIRKLLSEFHQSRFEDFPADAYARIGASFGDFAPKSLDDSQLEELVPYVFKLLRTSTYVSARAAYHTINATRLPEQWLEWNQLLIFLRTRRKYSLHSAFKRDDVLFTVS